MPGLPELKRLRRAAGLTREALGKMLDVPVTSKTIFNWETGARRPNSDDLRRIAAALNTTVGALLGEAPTAQGGAA